MPIENTVFEKESKLIKQVVKQMETAHNQHDADELDRHFTPDAVWVNVFGERLSGWTQINEAHKQAYDGPLQEAYAYYEVVNVSLVRSDIAITHIRQYPTTADGIKIEQGQGSLAIYVMVKENEKWQVAAGQNTLVQVNDHST